MIELNGVEVRAGGARILAVDSLALPPGLHAIIGPNGAGKTTLLRVLAGVSPYVGRALVCGVPPREARPLTGFMPATPSVDMLATAWNVIEAGLYGSRGPHREKVLRAARAVGVEALLDRRFSVLSGGEKRLVCLARVLARNPRVLLLDEPLSFLDLRNVSRAFRLLRSLAGSGRIVVATSHELHYISVFDTVTLLAGGRILYHGAPDRLPLALLEEAYSTRLTAARLGRHRIILPGDIFGGPGVGESAGL